MRRAYGWILRWCQPRLDETVRREMADTFAATVSAASTAGLRPAVRAAAAEYLDVLLLPFRRDPLAPRLPDGQEPRGGGLLPSAREWAQAFRRVRMHPGYAAIVVSMLALAIAINTVTFSVADSAMFRGLPYPNGDRLYELFSARHGGSNPGMEFDVYDEWRRQTAIFDALEGMGIANFVALGGGEPEQIGGALVTPGLFAALGVVPVRGRLFDPRDGAGDAGDVVIISEAVWRRQFGAADEAIGRTLTLNDHPFTIVGVMPAHFRFPAGHQQVWVARDARRIPRLEAVALLKRGMPKAVAQERLDTLAGALASERPRPSGWGVRLMPGRGTWLNPWNRRALQVLTVTVLVVLLIACANLANLGVAQALARQRELAIRAALGASRWRLVRELLAEHLVLGVTGGVAGLLFALWGVKLAIALAPSELTMWTANEIRIDVRVVAFTAAVTLASVLLFGLLPAWRASRTEAADALKARTGSAVAHGRLRTVLVVAEVAASVVLLVAATLLVRSFTRLTRLEPGFDPRGLTTASLQVPTDRYPAAARRDYIDRIAGAIRRMPGVESVAVSNGLPTQGGSIHFGRLQVEGSEPAEDLVLPNASVDPAYFSTMRIRLLAGRGFTADEPATSAVVSESLAQRIGGGVIGRRFRVTGVNEWWTVVGIAAEVRQSRDLERDGQFDMYTPLWRLPSAAPAARPARPAGATRSFAWIRLAIRTAPGSAITAPALKAAVWSVDPSQPVADILTMDEVLAESLSQDRFGAVLMGTFAGLALLLAAAGLYAVLAQLVAQRRQEIGIRMALGASTANVARLVVGRGLAMTAAGIAVGLGGAWATTRLLTSQLYDLAPHDPVSFAAVPLVLFAIAGLASWIPARRALSVDPVVALRAE